MPINGWVLSSAIKQAGNRVGTAPKGEVCPVSASSTDSASG